MSKGQTVLKVSPSDKKKALTSALNSLKKKYGEEVICTNSVKKIPSISTGSPILDIGIGIGGLPRGRIVEVYGENSSGKTTLFTCTMAQAQRQYPDEYVAFIDAEHAFDLNYAELMGLDISEERLLLFQPGSAEEALEIAESLIGSGSCSMIVIDSVAALQTKAQLDKDIGEATMGQVAKIMSETMPRLSKLANKTGTLACFVNQVRQKVGVMYGNPDTTPGGKALPYYSSVRLEIKRMNILLDKEVPYGQQVSVKVAKNKVGTPFKKIETNIIFGKGFDSKFELVEVAILKEVITRKGAWYFMSDPANPEGDGYRFQGKEAIVKEVNSSSEFEALLTKLVYPEAVEMNFDSLPAYEELEEELKEVPDDEPSGE